MSDIIEISRLSNRFGNVQAVNDLSFRVKECELFAFLGINGAGKFTTINIMCGQLSKDSGTVQINVIAVGLYVLVNLLSGRKRTGSKSERSLGFVPLHWYWFRLWESCQGSDTNHR